MRYCYKIGGVPCRACDIEDVLDALDDYTPTVQPEPKRGKWKCSDDMYETAICSCCGYDTNEPWGWTSEHFMFCPSCGEKMEGVQDG